ncbi:MAG: hypothetical protein WC501_01975 [Candidatus Micrarchaeia archaeon]
MHKQRIPKKVFALASMYGAGEAIGPVVNKLRKLGTRVFLVSSGGATGAFNKLNVAIDYMVEGKPNEKEYKTLQEKMVDFDPTSILTGTNVQDEQHLLTPDQFIWYLEREILKIPTVALLDIWGNYSERFSDLKFPMESNRLEIERAGKLRCLPTSIAIMDEFAKEQMINEGFNPNVLSITGNPYFEYVVGLTQEFDDKKITMRKKILSKPVFSEFDENGKLVVFISDEIETNYPTIGFSEKSVLIDFLRSIEEYSEKETINAIIRPHPFRPGNAKDAADSFKTKLARKVVHNPTDRIDVNYYSIEEILYVADLVVGTFNNPLVTARLLGTPVISFQPELTGNDFQWYTNEREITTLVKNTAELQLNMYYLMHDLIKQNEIGYVEGATERVIGLLK